MGIWDSSGISWTICKQSASRSRQITTPTPHHSIFTGRMLFLTPNRVKALKDKRTSGKNWYWFILARCTFCHPTNNVKAPWENNKNIITACLINPRFLTIIFSFSQHSSNTARHNSANNYWWNFSQIKLLFFRDFPELLHFAQ